MALQLGKADGICTSSLWIYFWNAKLTVTLADSVVGKYLGKYADCLADTSNPVISVQ